jgi:hypothetical protein
MSFILGLQRDEDPSGSFQRYADYIASERHRFPSSALKLVDSDWYFGFNDHRAPHDAWLQDVKISEVRTDNADTLPEVNVRIGLLGAHHDGIIEFEYSGVISYSLQVPDLSSGHCDWRYDEFRLSESGHLIHEIEWCGVMDTGRWLIKARDVVHSWHPFEIAPLHQDSQTKSGI